MSSSAAVHFQSPINSSADAPSAPHLHFNADCFEPSARMKSRPRLAKLRKQSATQQARSRRKTAGEAGAGFNPFRSDQVTGNVCGLANGSDDCGSSNVNLDSDFVFGCGKSGFDSARDLKGQSEGEVGKSGDVESVFSVKRSDDESGNNYVNLTEKVSGDEWKGKLNSEGELNSSDFVFGACRNNLNSGLNVEKGKKGKYRVRVKNLSGERSSKTEFECQKHDRFGGNDNGRESSVNGEKPVRNSVHGMGAFGVKIGVNGNSDMGADVHESRSNSATYSGTPACNLSDEMRKLNIKHSEGDDVTKKSMNSHVNGCAAFVFGGNDKAFDYSSVSSGTDADGQKSCSRAAFENIDEQSVKAGGLNGVQNGSACGIAGDSKGIHCSKPSTSQEGVRDFQFGKFPECNVPEESKVNGAAASFSFSSFGLDSHPNNHASMGHSSSADNGKGDNSFASTPEASKVSFADFKPPKWDPSSFKDNLFPKLNKENESTQKGQSFKEKGSKCARRKLKPHSLNKKQTGPDHRPKENGSLKSPDSSGKHSPMDFSPYQETTASYQDVKVADELNDTHSTIPTHYKDEHLPATGRDQFCSSSVAGTAADAGVDFTTNTEKQKDDMFRFVHGVSDSKGKNFAFSTSTNVEGTPSIKPKQKRKFRRKIGCNSFVISPRVNGKFVSSVQFSEHPMANVSSHSDVTDRSQINEQFKEGGAVSADTVPPTCYDWRLRGNQAYKDGDLTTAEDFYTLGINSVPSSERSGCSVMPLLLCYSNRAATRMSLGKIREALEDCLMATALDPTFQKVQMRTANCHLLLGEVENAQQCYNKLTESGSVVILDRRVIVEAAEGLQKAQEVVKCMNNAAELLKERTSDAAVTALELVSKALSISLYSEKLLQMKAEALCLLQKYDAAIQLCEQSLHLAEKNFVRAKNAENSNSSLCDSCSSVQLWRWSLISKCYFHLGKLEASLTALEKLQHVSVADKCVVDNIEDSRSLASTIRELLNHKRAGNENFKMGKYTEAVENYTAALSCNIKSRPFVAICFCNRAAAHQALGQIADAIADCSVAIALDGNYVKAISRRATLHEMVRDYEQAACDLKRLIAILETQSNEKVKQSDLRSESNGVKELRLARDRLSSVEDQAKKGTPLDVYLILGIKSDVTATDIKKGYHKAALRHHPDKAGQLLARSEAGDESRVWKEISQEVYKDADRLFKMIGEAYAVLSDPDKRADYDLGEELRKLSKLSKKSGGQYKSPSNRTYSRKDTWKTYGHGRSYYEW